MRKRITGTYGLYEVDEEGNVWSVRSGRTIAVYDSHGYYKVTMLVGNGRYRKAFVHRLVANAFCHKISGKCEVNHINEDKHDNRASNLEWVTHSQNIRWGNGYYKRAKSIRKMVWRIDKNGRRVQYPSLTQAAQENGISVCSVSRAANKRGSACGYAWRFVK